MPDIDVEKALHSHFDQSGTQEFVFFCIARQGGRTALEILARAFIMAGKHAYIGVNLTGLRSMGTNSMVLKFSDTPNIPPGITTMHPRGVMFMHEELVWPDFTSFLGEGQLRRSEFVSSHRKGILMVCSSRAPEELIYPVDFEGTVATVDAEVIFTQRVSLQPPPSGITSLGLFVAATDDVISLEAVKEATMEHERLSKRVRELNVECIQEAYEKAQVSKGITLKGELSLEEYERMSRRRPSSDIVTPEEKSVSTLWRECLPVCDVRKCVCIECLAAYFCPEGAISWKDEAFNIDYEFCKGCGTCALECPENAIIMEHAKEVLEKSTTQRH